MSESSLVKLKVLRTAMLLKRDSNTGLSESTYFVEDLWTAGSEKPMRLFKNNFFYRTSPVAASDSFRFPSCNFIQKETGAKMFICEICKFFENIFWQNTTCEFWEVFQITSFIKHLSETAYFIYKLPNFNHHIQEKSISQVLFKHFIQEEKVVRRRSYT